MFIVFLKPWLTFPNFKALLSLSLTDTVSKEGEMAQRQPAHPTCERSRVLTWHDPKGILVLSVSFIITYATCNVPGQCLKKYQQAPTMDQHQMV